MNNVKGVCSCCGEERWYVHKAKKLCRYCNEKRKQEEKKAKGKKPYQYKRKPTGEKALFQAIWLSRPHECEHCGKKLYEPRVHYFAHIKSKGSAPSERLNPANIKILCYDFGNSSNGCHYLYDHGTTEQYEARKNLYRNGIHK